MYLTRTVLMGQNENPCNANFEWDKYEFNLSN